jgi:hypothetical protein
MDLTLLIILILGAFFILHLINTIRSLTDEIKEMKQICMNDKKFIKNTPDPIEKFNNDLIENIKYFKDMFDKK